MSRAPLVKELPGGVVQLPDGRQYRLLNEFELAAFVREGWRQQQIADVRLAIKLDAQRPPTVATPRPAKPALVPEQLAWAI